jgi:hypothetical protein
MKHRSYPIAFLTLAFCLPLPAQTLPKKARSISASNTPTATPSPVASPAAMTRSFPFHGMVSAIDRNGKGFTIAGKQKARVFKITERTVITRSGKPAALGDLAENEEVSGSYWKNADGTLEAKTVKLGPMEKAKTPTPSPSPKASASPETAASPNS